MNLHEILLLLMSEGINCEVAIVDDEFQTYLGDRMNGYKEHASHTNTIDAGAWLLKMAAKHYPEKVKP